MTKTALSAIATPMPDLNVKITDFRSLTRWLSGKGWSETTVNKHAKWVHPLYGTVIMPLSASDYRAILNKWTQIKRMIREVHARAGA